MKPASKSKERNTAGRCSIKEQLPEKTDGEFLVRKAAIAKVAIRQTAQDIAQNLKNTLDVPEWVKAYPIASMAAGLAAGVATGAWVMDKKEHWGETPAPEKPDPKEPKLPEPGPTLWTGLLGLALEASKGLLQAWMRRQAAPEPRESPNPEARSSP